MAKKAAPVAADVKENEPVAGSPENDAGDSVPVTKRTSSAKGKKAGNAKAPVKKIAKIAEEEEEDKNGSAESSNNEEEVAASEDMTEEEPAGASVQKTKAGEKMPAKRGRKPAEKKEEAVIAPEEEEEAVAEEPVVKGGRKPAAKGGKGKKEVEEQKEDEKEEEEEEKDTKKAAPKGRGGKKTSAKPDEEEKNDEKEAEADAPKKGRKATAKADDEPEAKKLKKEADKPAAKGRGKKAEKEEEEEEEAEKSAGRPKRGAAAKGAAATKKAVEEEEEEMKPKRGAKAAGKKAADKDDEEEEEKSAPAKSRGGKQPAKGRGKAKKAGEVEDDDNEDGPTSSKKAKSEEEDGKSGGKSMTKSIRRTVQVKGKVAVDQFCTAKASKSHVYESGDLIYDVMLNQTNIGNNNNKFYVIQLLEEDDKNHYSVWMRWGRVGYDGQNKLVECGGNLQKAIHEFSSKFEAKTKNQWPTAFADFQTYAGKYTMIEMDYDSGEGGEDVKMEQEQEEEEAKNEVKSKLDGRVQELMKLMCSIRTMTQAVKELEFDADKSPLGKLTQQQIKEGFACLGKIEKFIEKSDFGAEFKHAVNEYYTKVPHACGFRPPAMIKTPQLLKQEIELLDLLSGIEYAIKTMKQEKREDDVHPVDRHYASLNCNLNPMDNQDEEYKLVAEYLAKTHGSTHNIQMGLQNVFRVGRDDEDGNEELMEKIGNRKLLWHGSRLSNFFGILSQGLRIAPPEAPCTGYMFGKGVYFADMASKSGNYCYASEDGQTGFLLLAEVALGEENQLRCADYNANKLPAGKSSTWGMGRTMPDPAQNKKLNDKVVVPCGAPIPTPNAQNTSLLYNEFIVYNTQQIRMRYLLEVKFSML